MVGRQEAPDPAGTTRGCSNSARERGHWFLGTPVLRVGVFLVAGVSRWHHQKEGGLARAGSSRRCRGPPRAAPLASGAGCQSSPGDRG